MFRYILPLALVALLAACETTPLEQCQGQAHRALRENAEQIDIAQSNIERGYMLVPTRLRVGVTYCPKTGGGFVVCTGLGQPAYRRVKIDVAAEKAKLQVLLERREDLEESYAACAERYLPG